MKKLNTILAGIFAAISMTEITRTEHEEGAGTNSTHHGHHQRGQSNHVEGAYAVSHHHSEQENNENESGQTTESTNPAAVVIEFLSDASYQNYADDGVVQIQSLGDGSLVSQLNLSPEQQQKLQALKSKLQNAQRNQGVTTQSMNEDEDNNLIIQSISEEHADTTPAVHQEAIAQPLAQAVHVSSQLEQAVENQEHAAPIAQHIEEKAVVPTVEHKMEDSVVTEHQAHPVVAEQPAQPAIENQPAERIKIVKVYPVYDAAKSAFEMVKAAANDMFNYVYSFIQKEKTEVKVQCNCNPID